MATTSLPQSLKNRLRMRVPRLYKRLSPAYQRCRRIVALLLSSAESAIHRRRVETVVPVYPVREHALVALDGCVFQGGHPGIGRVWASVMAEWSVTGFAAHVLVIDRAGTAPRLPGFTYHRAPRLRAARSSADRTMLEAVCRAVGADLFVSTLYTTPTNTASLLLLHDMTPEVLGWKLSAPVWREKRDAIEAASAYVCVSRSTADDLMRYYPVARSKPCAVVPLAPAPSLVPAGPREVEGLKSELGLPETYFLFIGHREGYKNADLVFNALAHSTERDFGLLCVGGAPELEPAYVRLAVAVPVRVARLSDQQLAAAYTGAAALLYVSRYEGFGLPILEAMSCDCPVITCRNSALAEVAGDAAVYVGEDDAPGLARAMAQTRSPDARQRLIALGRARVAAFTWHETAERLARALLEASGA